MTVLVGFIPSAQGWAALRAATEAARRSDGRLVVVNTSRGDAYADPRYAQDQHLTEVRAFLDDAGVDYEVEQQRRGHEAADEVLDAAAAHRADLVVVGIRSRSPVGKLLLGSTAQRIILEAECPVLAVKATTTQP